MTEPRDAAGVLLRVPVRGGGLAVHRLGAGPAGAQPVLAVHGITSNGLAWGPVARQLAGRAALLAPDLRGRAESRHLPGPHGLAAHADDVVAVLDAAGVEAGVLVGHSMGAFVAALAAARHPGRVRRLVLVDGGLGFPAPAGADPDAVLEAVLGPALRRLGARFPGPEEYLGFWREHPAVGPVLADDATGAVAGHLLHDLVEDGEGGHRSSCSSEAVRTDGRDVLADAAALSAAARAGVPAQLLWAARGLLDEPQGLYDEERLAALRLPAHVAARQVPGTNHYSVLLGSDGARAVADAVAAAASSS
ncbi:alpha/beta fold hydrolase [Quadrisphaera sp. DSM 44207]|uniref:alpha/beta fold hydrolase n=1 Tax=Quadrisphaera sp. DSM 44207 TaxID=1881057 RepID=UPI00088CE1E3|nr:alpha/beta hydrolase [Quadrisphaera sp. DSM 44207]SDQ17418.1 Pimeloyl-ACP methyl ester carboxylesterase [Quadrisphaera sp. DSM 44207]